MEIISVAGDVLDFACGAGVVGACIAARHEHLDVNFLDNSALALKACEETLLANDLHGSVLASDGLSELTGSFDLVVSNPPYIPVKERDSMDANVREFEPASALFVPDEDPLVFYRHIAGFGQKALHPGGMLYLEIHENFGQQVTGLLQKSGFEKVTLRKDINGKDRMVRATIR